jgi:hypothetical protein
MEHDNAPSISEQQPSAAQINNYRKQAKHGIDCLKMHNQLGIRQSKTIQQPPQQSVLKLRMENLISNQAWVADILQERTPFTKCQQIAISKGLRLNWCEEIVQADVMCIKEHNLNTIAQHQVQPRHLTLSNKQTLAKSKTYSINITNLISRHRNCVNRMHHQSPGR